MKKLQIALEDKKEREKVIKLKLHNNIYYYYYYSFVAIFSFHLDDLHYSFLNSSVS